MTLDLEPVGDTELLDWIERSRVSLWPNDKKPGFTLFARVPGEYPVQVSGNKLRGVLSAGRALMSQPKSSR